LQANSDHRVDFHNPEVIGSDNNWWRLQILESLIQEHKPELNASCVCFKNWLDLPNPSQIKKLANTPFVIRDPSVLFLNP